MRWRFRKFPLFHILNAHPRAVGNVNAIFRENVAEDFCIWHIIFFMLIIHFNNKTNSAKMVFAVVCHCDTTKLPKTEEN